MSGKLLVIVLLTVLMLGTANGEQIVLSKGEIKWDSRLSTYPQRELTVFYESADTALTITLNDYNDTKVTFASGSLNAWREQLGKFRRWHGVGLRVTRSDVELFAIPL